MGIWGYPDGFSEKNRERNSQSLGDKSNLAQAFWTRSDNFALGFSVRASDIHFVAFFMSSPSG